MKHIEGSEAFADTIVRIESAPQLELPVLLELLRNWVRPHGERTMAGQQHWIRICLSWTFLLPFSCLVIPVVSAVARLTQVTAVAAHQSVNAAAAGEAATAAEAAAAGEAATAAEAAAAGEQAAAEALHAPI